MELPVRTALSGTDRPLVDLFDVALLDLDGVVYIGANAVPSAPAALSAARARGMRLAFVTNNAARPPETVAAHLVRLGIAAEPDEVTTSAQAAAHYLADRLPQGARVLVVGTVGLYEALREQGLEPVARAEPDVAAVVQGYSPDLDWRQLAEGAVAIGTGVPWVATNVDPTVPSARGPLPGNGSLVAALRHATGVEPVVTGKPDPTMHRESVLRSHAQRPVVVGDRLDTDIEGANAVGCPSLLVLSGVTRPAQLLAAPPELRPTYLSVDLRGLLDTHPGWSPADRHGDAEDGADAVLVGGWLAQADDTRITLARSVAGRGLDGPDDGSTRSGDCSGSDGLDGLRALVAASWRVHGSGSGPVHCHATDPEAESRLRAWGLA